VRRLAAIVLVALATGAMLGGAGAASASTLSTARARDEIARLVTTAYPDLEVGNVVCPPTTRGAAGTTFTCTVQVPGTFLVVDATQDGTTGQVSLTTPDAVLTKPAMEQFVAASTSIGALVDCGSAPAIVRRPGQTVVCHALLDDGTGRTVTLSVRDTAGTVVIASVT